MIGALAAPIVRAYCAPRARRFLRALDDVATAQRQVVASIAASASATAYARRHGLAEGDGIDAFRVKLPVVGYADIEPFIERQRAGAFAEICPGRVRCHEPTSGSGAARKWIPYNDALLGSFRGLFAIWAHDLLGHALQPRSGKCFISVSPAFGAPRGLQDDRDYLAAPLRAVLGRFMVGTEAGKRARTVDEFRRDLAIALVACGDLEMISVWNPSFLLILLDTIEARDPALLRALRPARRRLLESATISWPQLWPRLQLVSCWTGAAAAQPARVLAARLPQAHLQGKGLLATEAPVSVPLRAAGGCVPLVDEVFLEFEDAAGDCRLLHEIDSGSDYAVVVSQRGGLLRYRLGDRVRVAGRYRNAPLLDFVGRTDAVSDLVGEKLHKELVATVVTAIRAGAVEAPFDCVIPVQPAHEPPHYLWLCETAQPHFARVLDDGLGDAFRYREARALGQLAAPRVVAMPGLRRRVHDVLIDQGLRAGDIKDRVLVTNLAHARALHVALVGDGH